MPTYYVTNRVHSADGSVQPSVDGAVTVKRSPHDFDPALANFADVASVTGATMAQMVKEAQAMATASHVPMIVVFIHGFNNDPDAALASTSLAGLGLAANDVKPLMICFDWASNHEVWQYLTDEGDAVRTVPAVMKMLDFLHTYRDPANCPVNVNVIAHSMGSFVLMQSLKAFAGRLGNPAFLPYLNEVLLVAADIDSNALSAGGPGAGITCLSRRVTVYYSRWDNTLAVSRWAKHFGTARLGRNGPGGFASLPRNVAAVDCTDVVQPVAKPQDIVDVNIQALLEVHSSYWRDAQWDMDAARTLQSLDRTVMLETRKPLPPFQDMSFRLLGPQAGAAAVAAGGPGVEEDGAAPGRPAAGS